MFALGFPGYLPFGDKGSDVVFGPVGVEGHLEHAQEFDLVREEVVEQPVESGERFSKAMVA